MNQQSQLKQQNIIALIAMVALLLFMPLAKATHYADHDSTAHGIHCKICSSSVLDDFDLPIQSLIIAIVEFQTITNSSSPSKFFSLFTTIYLSRAPPINFH